VKKRPLISPRTSFDLKRKMTLVALVLLACAALLSAQESARQMFLLLVAMSVLAFLMGSVQLALFCKCPNCGASLNVRGIFPHNCPKCGRPT